MKDSNRSIYFLRPAGSPADASSVNFGNQPGRKEVGQSEEPHRFSFTTGSNRKPESVSFSTTRCSEKGCVFPASSPHVKKCSYHLHQQEEPRLFRSHQPTGLLLDPARLTPDGKEHDSSRTRDRRRLAAIWEQFQSDGTS
ncbi:MAG TPA: hypothetical protein VFC10_14200 [Terriglobia bacterium]|jgi:hypothetical protein|nr:hypothetical protein [Terriglobia bacterium]